MIAKNLNIVINELARQIKSLGTTPEYKADLNSMIKLAKGHVAVIAHYEAGDNAKALEAAFKVGALKSDYQGQGAAEHESEAFKLGGKISTLIAVAPKA